MIRKKKTAFLYAFPKTMPVLAGYLFLGAAYGMLMKEQGFGITWILAISILVYAGSLQYVGVTLLASGVHPLFAFAMALMINARHLFYGVSMLEKYNRLKRFKAYLIFSLTDETFSVVCRKAIPDHLSREWVYLWISLLDQAYWVLGSILGYLLGQAAGINTEGLDFALTALFVVIFIDQWKNNKNHFEALTGVGVSLVCMILAGRQWFIIPAMILIILMLITRSKKECHYE